MFGSLTGIRPVEGEASELSHRELGWRMVEMGEDIPYEAAYLAPSAEPTEAIIRHAQTLAGRVAR